MAQESEKFLQEQLAAKAEGRPWYNTDGRLQQDYEAYAQNA